MGTRPGGKLVKSGKRLFIHIKKAWALKGWDERMSDFHADYADLLQCP